MSSLKKGLLMKPGVNISHESLNGLPRTATKGFQQKMQAAREQRKLNNASKGFQQNMQAAREQRKLNDANDLAFAELQRYRQSMAPNQTSRVQRMGMQQAAGNAYGDKSLTQYMFRNAPLGLQSEETVQPAGGSGLNRGIRNAPGAVSHANGVANIGAAMSLPNGLYAQTDAKIAARNQRRAKLAEYYAAAETDPTHPIAIQREKQATLYGHARKQVPNASVGTISYDQNTGESFKPMSNLARVRSLMSPEELKVNIAAHAARKKRREDALVKRHERAKGLREQREFAGGNASGGLQNLIGAIAQRNPMAAANLLMQGNAQLMEGQHLLGDQALKRQAIEHQMKMDQEGVGLKEKELGFREGDQELAKALNEHQMRMAEAGLENSSLLAAAEAEKLNRESEVIASSGGDEARKVDTLLDIATSPALEGDKEMQASLMNTVLGLVQGNDSDATIAMPLSLPPGIASVTDSETGELDEYKAFELARYLLVDKGLSDEEAIQELEKHGVTRSRMSDIMNSRQLGWGGSMMNSIGSAGQWVRGRGDASSQQKSRLSEAEMRVRKMLGMGQ